jgi:hypothetical protein
MGGIRAAWMKALRRMPPGMERWIPGLGLPVVTASELLAEHPGAGVVDRCGFDGTPVVAAIKP